MEALSNRQKKYCLDERTGASVKGDSGNSADIIERENDHMRPQC